MPDDSAKVMLSMQIGSVAIIFACSPSFSNDRQQHGHSKILFRSRTITNPYSKTLAFSWFTLIGRVTILSMSTKQILALLIAERDKLDRAIEALREPVERREGRPGNPLIGSTVSTAVPKPTSKKRNLTGTPRKQQSERMRAFWAAKRNTAAKSQPRAANKRKKSAKAA